MRITGAVTPHTTKEKKRKEKKRERKITQARDQVQSAGDGCGVHVALHAGEKSGLTCPKGTTKRF